MSWSMDVYEWEFARRRMGLWGQTTVYEKVGITADSTELDTAPGAPYRLAEVRWGPGRGSAIGLSARSRDSNHTERWLHCLLPG